MLKKSGQGPTYLGVKNPVVELKRNETQKGWATENKTATTFFIGLKIAFKIRRDG